jgi:hypothetical protein
MNKKITILLLTVLFGGALVFGAWQSLAIKDFFNKNKIFLPTAMAIDYDGGDACVQDSQCGPGLYCGYGPVPCVTNPECASCADGVVYIGHTVGYFCQDSTYCRLSIDGAPGPACGVCTFYEGGGNFSGSGESETCVINNVDNLDKFIFKDASNNDLAFFSQDGNFAMYQYNQQQVIYNYINQNTVSEEFTAIKNGDWDYCADNDYNYYEIQDSAGVTKAIFAHCLHDVVASLPFSVFFIAGELFENNNYASDLPTSNGNFIIKNRANQNVSDAFLKGSTGELLLRGCVVEMYNPA